MKTATITEVKNGLSAFLDRVRAGESVLILDRGVPVARLEPVRGVPDPGGRLARLARMGLIEPARAAPPLDLVSRPGPALAPGASALAALLEERRTGR
jgi:prevent-host-death family protein